MNTDTKNKAVEVITRLAQYLGTDADADTAKALATDLQNLAAMIDPTRQHSRPSLAYHLADTTATESALIRLLDYLKVNELIAEETAPNAFIYVCTSRDAIRCAEPLQWLGSARLLAFFIYTFFSRSDYSRIWKTAEQCFKARRPITAKSLCDACDKVINANKGTKTENDTQLIKTLHRDFTKWIKEPQTLAQEIAEAEAMERRINNRHGLPIGFNN